MKPRDGCDARCGGVARAGVVAHDFPRSRVESVDVAPDGVVSDHAMPDDFLPGYFWHSVAVKPGGDPLTRRQVGPVARIGAPSHPKQTPT